VTTVGLGLLVLGLAMFLGSHAFASLRSRRDAIVWKIGEGRYKGLFSLVALVGLALACYGFAFYRRHDLIPVWSPPAFLRHATEALMWPALVMASAAFVPGHLKAALKHPLLAGVKLWAFAHLLSNGDLGGIVLFGSILAWAVYERIALKRRGDTGSAALQVGGWTNDALAILVGTILYLAIGFVFHPLLGVPVFAA
jgi:uncharacterized membrane protein